MASIHRTNPSPLPLLPRRGVTLFKIQGYAHRAPNRSLASSEGISPGSANSRGRAQGVYPGSMGTPRGRSGASAPPAAAEVRLLPDLERSLPSSSSGRARPPPPAAHRLSGVNNYFKKKKKNYFALAPPCPSGSRFNLARSFQVRASEVAGMGRAPFQGWRPGRGGAASPGTRPPHPGGCGARGSALGVSPSLQSRRGEAGLSARSPLVVALNHITKQSARVVNFIFR